MKISRLESKMVEVDVCNVCGEDISSWDDSKDICNDCAAKNFCLEDGHTWVLMDVAVSATDPVEVYGTCEVCYDKMLFRVFPIGA